MSWCRTCQHAEKFIYYRANKGRHRDNQRKARASVKAELDALKHVPCADCGGTYPPYIMDFDHINPDVKEHNVARLRQAGSRDKLRQEIAKCEVVCANCHRERTHKRGYQPVQRLFKNPRTIRLVAKTPVFHIGKVGS